MLQEAFQIKKMQNLEKVPKCQKVSEAEKYDFNHLELNMANCIDICMPIQVKKSHQDH